MTQNLRTRFFSGLIFFTLIASAVFTVPARADSGSPPPVPTAPGGTTHNATQVPSAVTNSGGSGDQGHKVELSTQGAAYIAPAGDPIWCPSGVAVPMPGAGGCSANYGNLYLLTSAVEGGTIHPVLTNSNIWIQHGADSSINQPILDGSVLTSLSNFSLNFKGGWNGLGTGSVNHSNPSTFTQGLQITNWNNNISLNDVQFNNISTGTWRGIYITTKGNITLTSVQANNDPGYGAYLNNTINSGSGTVTITNGQFNGDAIAIDISLYVVSNNAITLTNVMVDNGWTTKLDNSTGMNKPVTIKSSSFDNNRANGLTVISMGAITLTNVSASGSFGFAYGANLDNHNSLTAAPVTLTGMNTFDSNGNYGLFVYSKGKVTSTSISASKNIGFGLDIDNSTALSPLPVSLTGNSTFNGNGLDGLVIQSLGAITANNLTANDNLTGGGAVIQNNFNPASPFPVKVIGTNEFSGNHNSGLYIDSNGPISLNNITASGNGTTGADAGLWVENRSGGSAVPQKVVLTGVNNFDLNTNGLVVEATGAISISNITEFGNSMTGIWLDNKWLGSAMPQLVILLGHNSLTHSGSDNLDVSTYGAITISNLTASDSLTGSGANLGFLGNPGNVTLIGLNTFNHNGSAGLLILNKGSVITNGLTAISNTGVGVVIDNTPSASSPVTLKGINTFNFNGDGITIVSNGAVLTNGLTAISNNSNGVIIQNGSLTSPAPVTLKGINTFNKNMGPGLTIFSYGAVLANHLSASSNTGNGVDILNSVSPGSAPVSLMGLSSVNFNGGDGLKIVSHGPVLTNGLIAVSNNVDGASLNNGTSGGPAPVTLKGINIFNNNISSGLDIFSKGTVVTTDLTAVNNLSDGANIDNFGSSFSSPVTLMGPSIFNLNGSDGLYITTRGAVLTNGLTALTNVSDGVYISNSTSPSSAPVTLKGLNLFNNNTSDGVYIGSMGAVTASGLTAINNASDGMFIDNSFSTTAPVTLIGLSTFNFNHSGGLFIVSRGGVLTNGLIAMNNNSDGVFIDNSGSTASPVKLNGLNIFDNNSSDGLYLAARGAVLTSSLSAVNNGSYGVFIDNGASNTNAPVALGGKNTFSGNSDIGLEIDSKGAITTNNLTASYNGAYGALMDNATGGPIEGINVKGKNVFFDNSNAGLALTSLGSVTMTNVSSKLNHNNGLSVNTPGNVIVSCGSFISNGMSHISGYGWETGLSVPHITLIGVTSFGNFSGDTRTDNGATVVTNIAHPCVLP